MKLANLTYNLHYIFVHFVSIQTENSSSKRNLFHKMADIEISWLVSSHRNMWLEGKKTAFGIIFWGYIWHSNVCHDQLKHTLARKSQKRNANFIDMVRQAFIFITKPMTLFTRMKMSKRGHSINTFALYKGREGRVLPIIHCGNLYFNNPRSVTKGSGSNPPRKGNFLVDYWFQLSSIIELTYTSRYPNLNLIF